jgi:hypothetical protein
LGYFKIVKKPETLAAQRFRPANKMQDNFTNKGNEWIVEERKEA